MTEEKKSIFLESLQIDPKLHKVIAVVGGGGKTSLIFQLSKELTAIGKKVIVTTTTHMAYEAERPFAKNGDQSEIALNLSKYGYTVSACFSDKFTSSGVRKICSLSENRLVELKEECDVLLIEADGSKGLPIKAPSEQEPVIPKFTNLVIGIVGSDSIGKKIEVIAHRPELLGKLLDKNVSEEITVDDIVKLAVSRNGLRKLVGDKEYRVFFNKADVLSDQNDSAVLVCRNLLATGVVAAYGSLQQEWSRSYKLSVVLLAAGYASRFGSNKLLYEIDGKTMCDSAFDLFAQVREEICASIPLAIKVVVVTQYDEVADKAKKRGFQTVRNLDPSRGISSSMQIGLREAIDSDACLFSVCDQPWLTVETVKRFIVDFLGTKKGMASVTRDGIPGNPCIFSRRYYDALMNLSGDKGGKGILLSNLSDVSLTECTQEIEMEDIDLR